MRSTLPDIRSSRRTDTAALATGAGTSALACFQDDLMQALLGRADGPAGLAVYRNTAIKACVDALAANYPSVARLVGDEWMRAAAAMHARASLPCHPRLVEYGDEFPAFLADFAPALQMPWLADVARIDRMWTEAHLAADAPVVDARRLAALSPAEIAAMVLEPHPSARWRWFDHHPAYAIWRRNRIAVHDGPGGAAQGPASAEPGGDFEPAWKAEGALIVRPHAEVIAIELDRAGFEFLQSCAEALPLHRCAASALRADPGVDLAALLAQLLRAGAFSGARPFAHHIEDPS